MVVNSATYRYSEVNHPPGGSDSLCILPYPKETVSLADVEVTDVLCDRSVSVRAKNPQYVQAASLVSGKILTCGSVNLTLGIGMVSWSGSVVVTQTLPRLPALFFPHRLWDGHQTSCSCPSSPRYNRCDHIRRLPINLAHMGVLVVITPPAWHFLPCRGVTGNATGGDHAIDVLPRCS